MAIATRRDLQLTVTDLKQWAYCQRIPFYHHVMPVEHAPTYRMRRGKVAQAAIEALERRRRFREYGMPNGERRFDVWLRSPRLGLAGRLDLLIVTADACFPIDFKDTEGGVRRNHRVQLAGYALLVEEAYSTPVTNAFVFLIPSDEVIRIEVSSTDREEVLHALTSMREMIAEEKMPDPTPVRARCFQCEYRNYCGDIW